MLYGFPKSERLRKRREFLFVSGCGTKTASKNFLVLSIGNSDTGARIGITVSRKIGNAVTRNRIKRMVREFYRMHKELFAGADYNIIARQGSAALDFRGLNDELDKIMRRLKNQNA